MTEENIKTKPMVVPRVQTTDWLNKILRVYGNKYKTQDKFIMTAKLLLDTGAVVSIAPKKEIQKLLNNWISQSKLRVLTANGKTERAGGEFETEIKGCAENKSIKFYCLNNAQDWLISFSVLEELGYRCYLGGRSDGKGYLITSNGSIITIHRETDGCYSVYIEFTTNDKGDLKFRFIDERRGDKNHDEFMEGPATAFAVSHDNFQYNINSKDDEDDEASYVSWEKVILKQYPENIQLSCEMQSHDENNTLMECFDYMKDEVETKLQDYDLPDVLEKKVNWKKGTQNKIGRLMPKEGVDGLISHKENDETIESEEFNLPQKVMYFCDVCKQIISKNTCLCGTFHDLNKAVEIHGEEITVDSYQQDSMKDGFYEKCYFSQEIPSELKLSSNHAESPRGLLGILDDEKNGIFQSEEENSLSKKKNHETLTQRREKIKSSFNRSKEGGIIHRFPLQNDSMELHQALGHPSDMVLAKMEETLHGVPVMKRVSEDCELCRSLRRRKIPRKTVDGIDHTVYLTGESVTIDFTRYFEQGSIEGEHVGLLCQINNTGYPLGLTMKDHKDIIGALDIIYKFVRTKLGVSLIHIHADCDSMWYSVEGAQDCLTKVARWCFHFCVKLSTNSPGISQQNGVIESTMSKVMALTSI